MPASRRLFALVTFSTFALVGCSSGVPSAGVRVTPADPAVPALTAAFPPGVGDVRDSGETTLVFACVTGPAGGGDGPAVRQVLDVRVMWQPAFNVKADMRGTSHNAALHWTVSPVVAGGPAGGGVVEYRGTGFVELARNGDRLTATIRSAAMAPAGTAGRMRDPVGPAVLTGTLVARQDPAAATAALGERDAVVAAAKLPAGGIARASARTAEASLPTGQ